jgi:hypothetical protein
MKIQGFLKSAKQTMKLYGGKRIPGLWSFSRRTAGKQDIKA